jgi:Xaa-Pro aminopeptidase
LKWNDHFESGDVFALEPGMYGSELQAGLRIEEIYHLSETGLNKLTKLPLTFN